jgi:hypothetical protein
VETQRADHAREIVTGLSLSELESFDGFVAVRKYFHPLAQHNWTATLNPFSAKGAC